MGSEALRGQREREEGRKGGGEEGRRGGAKHSGRVVGGISARINPSWCPTTSLFKKKNCLGTGDVAPP